MFGLLAAEAEAIATKLELDRIAQRRPAENFDRHAVAKAHFKEAPLEFTITFDGLHRSGTPDAELIERTNRAAFNGVTRRQITRLFHSNWLLKPAMNVAGEVV
jgi:purine nucleoside permease